MGWLKPIIAGLFTLWLNAFMYYSGRHDGYVRGYKAGYEHGNMFGYWRRGRELESEGKCAKS